MPENPRSSGRRCTVKKFLLLSLPLILGLLVAPASPQTPGHHFPTPPERLDTSTPEKESTTLTRRLDMAQLQKEAEDLARTAQTIPSDVASVRKGMMPKDVIEKLKQIEKLSKRLRTELNP
jgi:hypothetical protein